MALRAGNYISLASGGGGLDLGVDLGSGGTARPVCYVENEATAAALLVDHMEAQRLPAAPLWSDLRTFDFGAWRGRVDGIIGGYPCQPFSTAGARRGEDDPRHLWPAIAAGIRAADPSWCFFENVGGHLSLGFREVARELQGMGYSVTAALVTAEEVGAPHKRERIFILAELADTDRSGRGTEPRLEHQARPEVTTSAGALGDDDSAWPPGPTDADAWRRIISVRPDLAPAVEPVVCRGPNVLAGGLDGLSRSDRLRILGNGVVPPQASFAWRYLWSEFGVTS